MPGFRYQLSWLSICSMFERSAAYAYGEGFMQGGGAVGAIRSGMMPSDNKKTAGVQMMGLSPANA
jgi:hypothetical protein